MEALSNELTTKLQFLEFKNIKTEEIVQGGNVETTERHLNALKPGFHIVVPVARIVSVASNFWKRQGRSSGNALAITQDDPCDRNDQSSEIDSSSILATETTGKDSQAIAYF